MKKWLLGIIGIILILSGTAIAGGPSFSGGGSGAVATASDCDVAAYYTIGKLCQDTDDGKLYKGTGAAVVEIAAGSSGDVVAATTDITWGDGTGPEVFTFSVTGTDPTITATASKIAIAGTLDLGANNITTTGSLGATGAGKLTKGWFVDLESTNMPSVNGTAIDATFMPIGWISRAGTNNVLTYTGNYSLGLTLSNNTAVTLPTSGTLATTAFKPSDLSITDQAAGDVLYFNGTNWVRLAADAGKYLKSGASAVSWDTPVGGGTIDISGTPANHYWTSWTDDNTVKGTAITSSKPVCSDASGDPAVCAGTEGVWQVADADLTALAGLTSAANAIPYFTGSGTAGVISSNAGIVTFLGAALGAADSVVGVNSAGTALEYKTSLSISSLNLTSATSSIPWVAGTATASNTDEGTAYWESDTDTLTIGDGTTGISLDMTANTVITFPTATATLAKVDSQVFTTYIEAPYLILGSAATAADAGAIRLPNAAYIMAEADAASTDISVIGVDSSEVVQIGASGASGVTITPATTVTGALTLTANPKIYDGDSHHLTLDVADLSGDATLLLGSTFTNTKWCSFSSTTGFTCNEDAPAGSGDITAVGSCATGSCAQIGNADTSGGYIDLLEDSDNGTNYVRLKAPDSTADVTVTLPAATDTLVGKATTDTLTNKTIDVDGTGNVVKSWGYIVLTHPHLCAASAPMQTTSTANTYGQCKFSNNTDKATNYAEYYLTVPADVDTDVDLVGTFKFKLSAADTADHEYEISFDSVADSAAYAGSLGDAVSLGYTADASGAENDVETATGTLTGWRSAMAAGNLMVVRVARDGDNATDASTVDSYSGPLVIKYKISQ